MKRALRGLGLVATSAMLVALGGTAATASDVNVAVVDVTVPTASVSLQRGQSGPITIQMSVVGAQAGTATFEVYRTWTLANGGFTGSDPQEFTVAPRAGGDPATTFSTSGSVKVSSTEAAGGPFTLAVRAFDITNTNSTGAKLAAGSPSSYQVTVTAPPPPSDKTPPVLTLPADITAEASDASGATVTYSATATDAVDGTVPVTCSPVAGSTFPLGATTVTCSATDKGANTATGSFTVTAVDTTAPVIASHGDLTAEATSAAGGEVSYIAPSTSDAVDGQGTADCSPASGSDFAYGPTTVTCTAKDAAGNEATPTTFTVTVQDTTAPVIADHGNVTAEATSKDGATVSYTAPATTDAVDGDGLATCTPASGDQFPLGTTTVTCTAKDAAGNEATPTTFTVTVVDTTAPVLTLPGDMQAKATSAVGAVVQFTATATDIVDGSVPVACSPASGTTFAVGDTTVTCSATDKSGNTGSGSFTVTVSYSWDGFFRPVDNQDGAGNYIYNSVKAGQGVPMKFSLGGNMGLSIFQAASPTSYKVDCGTNNQTDVLEETVTAGGSTLSYDSSANQYNYVWKTDKAWAGSCRAFKMTLLDGSAHWAYFRFTK